MKILYLRTSSFQCDPHVGSIVQYAEEMGDIEVQIQNYFVDNPDTAITEWVANFKPDYVIWLGVCGGPHQPSPTTFWLIRKSGTKTIMLCPEASHPDWDKVIKEFYAEGSFDKVINLDGGNDWDKRANGITTLAIFDQRPYRKSSPWQDRPIDVGFCGGVGFAGTMRQRLVEHFKQVTSCKFKEFPFLWETKDTYQQYADFMMSCKVIINPAHSSQENVRHVKGRVIEAGLAGCALVEEEGSPINRWFTPGTYYTFTHPVQAEMAVLDLLENPEQAMQMANKLNHEVHKQYSPRNLWAQIL